jgi:hypothetical protein
MSVDNSRFKKLMESKLGNVKPLITEDYSNNEVRLDIGTDIIGNSKSGEYQKNRQTFTLKTDNNEYTFTYEDFPGKKELFRLIPNTDQNNLGTWTRDGNEIIVKTETNMM